MNSERKIVIDGGANFEADSVEKYRLAATFMVVVAEECFGIEFPEEVFGG